MWCFLFFQYNPVSNESSLLKHFVVGFIGNIVNKSLILCNTIIFIFTIWPLMDSGKVSHLFKSSFIVFSSGVKLRWNNSDSLVENIVPKYVMLPVVSGKWRICDVVKERPPCIDKTVDFFQFIIYENRAQIWKIKTGKTGFNRSEWSNRLKGIYCPLSHVNISFTLDIYCTSVRPGRGIPHMWLSLRFLLSFYLLKGFF